MKTYASVRKTLKQIRKEIKSKGPTLLCESETWISKNKKKKSVKIKEGSGSASFMKSKGENQTHDNFKIGNRRKETNICVVNVLTD
jgi:hypothetical protein